MPKFDDEKCARLIDAHLSPALKNTPLDPGVRDWMAALAGASLKELLVRYSERPFDPEDAVGEAVRALELNQRTVLEHIRSFDSGYAFACAEGCSYCCHSHLVAMPHEVVAIALGIPAVLDSAALERVREHCRDIAAMWDEARASELITTYFAPCPFLRDGRCSIYALRPIACRNWFSRSVAACKASFDSKNKIPVPQTAVVMHLKDVVYASHAALCELAGLDGGLVSLFVALDAMFEAGDDVVGRWGEGRPFPGRTRSDKRGV